MPSTQRRNLIVLGAVLALLLAVAVTLLATAGGGQDAAPPDERSQESGEIQDRATLEEQQGTLRTSTGTLLLPTTEERIDQLVGEEVDGRNLTVQTVPGDGGFWVGTSESARYYVASSGTSQPEPNERVDLSGTIREVGDGEGGLELDDDDRRQLEDLGAYVEADEVTPTE